MTERYAVVVTTINHPTRAVIEIAEGCGVLNARFIIVGDTKSPKDFAQPGADYLDVDAQLASGFRFAKAAPFRHYARKNVGYLAAIKGGATVIIETDDDNIPADGFWNERTSHVPARSLQGSGWANVYAYFSDVQIWPRGLPLDHILKPAPELEAVGEPVFAPIQQGLADANPDVDAIYRLVLPLPVDFKKAEPVALGEGAWCPFNSQNTTWWAPAFPLLYLPSHCSFRMTDIWRSFVAQRIAQANGWSLLFHNATVVQERNEHNLMRDFEDEVSGYVNNDRMVDALKAVEIAPGEAAIPDNLRRCYAVLVERGWVGAEEPPLLEAWLADLADLDAAQNGAA